MKIIKRSGEIQSVDFNQILNRLKELYKENDIDLERITQFIINQMRDGMTTLELDVLSADICANMIEDDVKYDLLASKILISNLHKETKKTFSEYIEELYNSEDNVLEEKYYNFIIKNKDILDSVIINDNDYKFRYFGIKTLERSYLLKRNNKIIERPQYMFMRVSICIHFGNLEKIIETYRLLSEGYFIHATPTLFNACTRSGQLASCFLLKIEDDSVDGIFNTLKDCAKISKQAGGIGLSIQHIRPYGSKIKSINGTSSGIIPMIKVFNDTTRYINQGGKRNGSIAVYLEPWHSDILEFLEIRKNTGLDENKSRDIFTALWIPDLFMIRLKEESMRLNSKSDKEEIMWSLFNPNTCPNLENTFGDEFNELYIKYENEKKYEKQINILELWNKILESCSETGTPYICFKDNVNRKNNQKNLGTIKCSNLCAEIVEYTSPNEIAVCNLASLVLNKFVCYYNDIPFFNFEKLKEITKIVTYNLNNIIDVNKYPVEKAKYSNLRNRPIGIGVQGLADTFILMRLPFTSNEAKELNKLIFETIYYGALEASCELASEFGPYETYNGSYISEGKLHFDHDNITPSDKWNWNELRNNIKKFGVRNSLLIALMPTASTAQILGNNESIEPYISNIYTRKVLSGYFQIVNKYLIEDLKKINLWNNKIKNEIIENYGSIQNIKEIPNEIKELYKTIYELSLRDLIQMNIDRSMYVDQSISFNIFIDSNMDTNKLTNELFYSWKNGIKTGMYYLRSKPASNPMRVTVCKNKAECLSCSS